MSYIASQTEVPLRHSIWPSGDAAITRIWDLFRVIQIPTQ